MTNTQHTPGPWFLTPEGYGVYKGDSYGDRGDMVCTLPGYGSDASTRIANARLIAAAPELLSALEDFCRECDGYLDGNDGSPWGTLLKGRAAIAKATGQ